MEHIDLCKIRTGDYIGKTVAVCGWVRTSRDSKNVAFVELNDGSVPHSGFGLGLERIMMYITGMSNIRDTVEFPRTKDELR